MFLFRSSKEEISRTNPGYEETERRTPATGKILLILMFFAGLFFGWQAVDDVARLVTAPSALSSCSYRYQENIVLYDSPVRPYEYKPLYYQYSQTCQFGDLETLHGIPALYTNKRLPLENQRQPLVLQYESLQRQLSDTRGQIQRLLSEYGVGLQEKAGEVNNPIFPTDPIAQQLRRLQQQEKQLLTSTEKYQAQLNQIDAQVKTVDSQLVKAYAPVFKEQNRKLRWYEFKVFLLEFLFFIPLFFLVYRWYLRLHRSNSPYTVIVTAMVGVTGVLVLRIILEWFWGLFLKQVIETLWEWLNQIIFFQTIALYLGMILSFAIFGGAVYYLQKKIFDPRRVTIRRFRAKQCPHCQTNLDLSGNFCPNCSGQIKEECPHCKHARFVGLPACPACGKTKE